MKIWRALLFPFAIVYDLITRIRNYLFDIGHKKSFRFQTMVISVGNLNVGGSGKTPMVEYLIRLLSTRYKIATLSRGYGRTTRGFRIGTQKDSSDTLGDEPIQLLRKFKRVTVSVGEDRAFAIPNILHAAPDTDVIILDDAFQHRPVDPQLSVLLTDFHLPFYKDFLLPAGNLREARKGAARCHAAVVTRCPQSLSQEQRERMSARIHGYAPGVPVFFAGVRYRQPEPFGSEQILHTDVVLISGIAKSDVLRQHIASHYNLLHHFEFRDHHRFGFSEVEAIHEFCRRSGRPVSLVTTEKDMVRLLEAQTIKVVQSNPWFCIPIEMYFVENGSEFDAWVVRSIEKVRSESETSG